jgi:predicted nucleotidyltransferase
MTTHHRRLATAAALSRWLNEQFGEDVVEVRLYGSVARGTDGPGSDIDLLILTRRPLTANERQRLSRQAYEQDLKRGTVTQCLVRTLDQWERPEVQCGGLARTVARESVTL